MKKFEYRVSDINLTDPSIEGGQYYIQEWLNQQGAEGWELVDVKARYPYYNFFFKREIWYGKM